jgi:hypothetical protein
MTFKVVNISDPGTSTRHGADDQDKIAKYLNGVDVIDPVIINTDTIIKSNRLIFRDLSDSYNINIITSAETQSGSLTIPTLDGNVTLLLDNDARLYDARTPQPHTVTHQAGQSDPIPIDQLAPPTDINNALLNATTTTHGLMPTLSADGLTYLDGNGNWTSPSGTGVLPDGSLTNAKLADDTITANKIAPATITDSEIAPGAAIARSKLGAFSLVNADINASAAIDWTKISKTGSLLEDLSNINTAGKANGDLIKWDSTTSKWISFTPAAGGGAVIPDDNSVTTAKIVNLAVTAAKIANATITATQIANNAITTALITDGNVTLAKLSSNSVDSSKIVDGSIMNADVNTSAAIAWTKVSKSGSVLSDIGNTTGLGSATTGQVLTYNGAAWYANTPSTGGSSGSVSPVSPNKKWGLIMGGANVSTGGAVGSGMCSGWITDSLTGGSVTEGIDSTGAYISLNTATGTSQTNAEINSSHAKVFLGSLGFKIWTFIKFNNVNNNRWYVGVTDTIALAENTFNFLNSKSGFGIRYDTTTDTTIQLIYNNGASSQNVHDTLITPVSGTTYLVTIEYTGSSMILTINGGSPITKTTGIPASSTTLGWIQRMQTSTSAQRIMQVYYTYCEV